ncbi:MAG: hypothetical protein Q4A82_01740 [Corynebacterium sp.]|nr:hypothetical protein [Corynebacterium sp.]
MQRPDNVLQLFVEELHLYCSSEDANQVATRLHDELIESFSKMHEISAFTIEAEEEDEYDLAEELSSDIDPASVRPYMVEQPFSLFLRDNGEEEIDAVSDQVFAAVQKAVKDVPYFSFLNVDREDDEDEDDGED